MDYIDKFILEIKQKPLDVIKDLIETATPKETASYEMIKYSEDKLNIKLPEAYKKYITQYSNGDFYMLGVEPMVGVGKKIDGSLCKLCYSNEILMSNHDKEVFINQQHRSIRLNQLIPFTFSDSLELSNDHWAFICDKEYTDNDYPIGYISQVSKNVVCVLKNFEEWLRIFWEHNKDLKTYYVPVFHILFPDEEDRYEILRGLKIIDNKIFK